MGGPSKAGNGITTTPPPPPPPPPPLHTSELLRRTYPNRVFALVYACAILALLYRHSLALLRPPTLTSFFISLALLLSDTVLAFMWATTQSCRMRPIRRREFLDNLTRVIKETDYPALDVFICTADPFKEPPMSVVNTVLSVMAYDYPTGKMSFYVSDDGGSDLTLFAFVEAAKFATYWLPYCRKNRVEERSPEVYYRSHHACSPESEKLKMMYESMNEKVESVMERGRVSDEFITSEEEREAFRKWTNGFARQDHPTVIQVLLENGRDKDVTGHDMPNLVYVSRQKSKTAPHHFKAGALNVLLRVSAAMTNAPVVMNVDCDNYSNDPRTPLRVLCYLSGDPEIESEIGYIQFPQRFHGVNKNDIYGGEHKRLYQINPVGMDGLQGTTYVGSGCFFRRRAFFGGPSSMLPVETPELNPDRVVGISSIRSNSVLELAHHFAGCNYENGTAWGSKMGFRYGSLSEDYFTGYQLQIQGWKSVFCNPERAAFLGDVPINLTDVLSQNKRWCLGLLQVTFSKYNAITFGVGALGILMGLAYANNAFWATWFFPITIYGFLPQITLLHGVSIFPKVSESWFYLYLFLFMGAYVQDCLDFVLAGGTFGRWWSDQRMWMIRGVSSYLFGFIEYWLKSFGISTLGFTVTSKVIDDEQRKRYDQGIFDFGVVSPLFVPLAVTAILNLISFWGGLIGVLRDGSMDGLFLQLLLTGFVMVNCWPIYEAMVLRSDRGRMPVKITIISVVVASALYVVSYLTLRI